MDTTIKQRAPRNRTLALSEPEKNFYSRELLRPPLTKDAVKLRNQIICGDALAICPELPKAFVDLLILDPPYNLNKKFGGESFREMTLAEYEKWFENWFVKMLPMLKPTATLYVCGDWKSSAALHRVLERHVTVRNRITWEREKGRGAKVNWKNASEDIWFCTMSNNYHFDVEAVKLKRKVIAPYRENGLPKDWDETDNGDFRLTHPSNLWTDLTVPFWSMPENTDHRAKAILYLIRFLVQEPLHPWQKSLAGIFWELNWMKPTPASPPKGLNWLNLTKAFKATPAAFFGNAIRWRCKGAKSERILTGSRLCWKAPQHIR